MGCAPERPTPWLSCGGNVAHGLGAVNGLVVSNSREALAHSYDRGFRLFEIDVELTSDGQPAFTHDWQDEQRLQVPGVRSSEQWRSSKVYGRLHPVTVEEMWSYLAMHEDLVFILDIKGAFAPTLRRLVESAPGRETLFRVVPQIFTPEQALEARSVFPFPSLIFTLYRSKLADRAVAEAVESFDLAAVTMHESRFSSELAKYLRERGVAVFVHTVNQDSKRSAYLAAGATAVYTDSLPANYSCQNVLGTARH